MSVKLELYRVFKEVAEAGNITEADAAEMGVKNGEIIKVACGGEGRKLIFDDVVVRVNKDAVTTMHIDTDESQAAGNPKVGEIVR